MTVCMFRGGGGGGGRECHAVDFGFITIRPIGECN